MQFQNSLEYNIVLSEQAFMYFVEGISGGWGRRCIFEHKFSGVVEFPKLSLDFERKSYARFCTDLLLSVRKRSDTSVLQKDIFFLI